MSEFTPTLTITVNLTAAAAAQLNSWLDALYRTGNLTGDDPAHIFTGLVLRALLTNKPALTIDAAQLISLSDRAGKGQV